MSNQIKIILVDDHPIVRQGIKELINTQTNFKVCCEADNANDAINLLSKHKINCAIVDLTIKGNVNGLELIKAISTRYDKIKILVLSMHNESLYAERCIKAGAKGYIMKGDEPHKIIDAINTIMNDNYYLSNEISKKIISKMVNQSIKSNNSNGRYLELLTNRELEIFNLIGNGFSSKEISQQLKLTLNTIDAHKRNIREKLNLKNSAQLTKNAIQWIITNNQNP